MYHIFIRKRVLECIGLSATPEEKKSWTEHFRHLYDIRLMIRKIGDLVPKGWWKSQTRAENGIPLVALR